MRKSGKREIAILCLTIYFGLLIWGACGNHDSAAAADTIKVETFALVMAAFGYDATIKQLIPTLRNKGTDQ